MKFNVLIATIVVLLTTMSCANRTSVLPTASGRPGDLLIVIDDEVWESPGADTLKAIFEQDIVGLPWDEPLFDISRVNQKNFINILSTARSIIDVEVSKTYTQPKVRYQKELYSKTQRYIKIQLPDIGSLQEVVEKEGLRMISYLYKGERDRYLLNYRKFSDKNFSEKDHDTLGVYMIIPSNFSRQNFNDTFVWMASRSNDVMEYIAVYTYDYTSVDQLKREALLAKRDELMKANIQGANEGSYMQTGDFYPAVFSEFKIKDTYVAELRGIWETEGDMMGGPFISHSRVDEKNGKIVTVEVFIYAPNQKKRNAMRQLESLLYTVQLEKPEALGKKDKTDDEEQ